jgi:hypothetical protein
MKLEDARKLFGEKKKAEPICPHCSDIPLCHCGEPECSHAASAMSPSHTFTPMSCPFCGEPDELDETKRVEDFRLVTETEPELTQVERDEIERAVARTFEDGPPGTFRHSDGSSVVHCPSGFVVKVSLLTMRDEMFITEFQRKRKDPNKLMIALLERKCEIISFGPYSGPMNWENLRVSDSEAIAKALKE